MRSSSSSVLSANNFPEDLYPRIEGDDHLTFAGRFNRLTGSLLPDGCAAPGARPMRLYPSINQAKSLADPLVALDLPRSIAAGPGAAGSERRSRDRGRGAGGSTSGTQSV